MGRGNTRRVVRFEEQGDVLVLLAVSDVQNVWALNAPGRLTDSCDVLEIKTRIDHVCLLGRGLSIVRKEVFLRGIANSDDCPSASNRSIEEESVCHSLQ
jgi:hypothetical protein